jgi:hypothetical protein
VENFYTNITVFGAPLERIRDELTELGRDAFIAKTSDGGVVYDRTCEEQNTEDLSALAEHLSERLAARALAVLNHDDDILWFQLYDRAELIVEYANQDGPGTSARAVCRAFGRPAQVIPVWIALHRPYVFQVSRHARLVHLLGLPNAAVGTGFNYISHGEPPLGVDEGDLIRVSP